MTAINLAALPADVQAYIASLQAKAIAPKAITFKVTTKRVDDKTGKEVGTDGAISAYGLGRFPVTLYRGQWERLIAAMPQLEAFIAANKHLLSVKEAK